MVAGALTAALFGDVAAMPRRIGPFTSLNQDPKSEVHLWCNRDLPVIVHPGLPLELPPSPGWRTEQVLLNKNFLTSALQNCSESLPIDRASFQKLRMSVVACSLRCSLSMAKLALNVTLHEILQSKIDASRAHSSGQKASLSDF